MGGRGSSSGLNRNSNRENQLDANTVNTSNTVDKNASNYTSFPDKPSSGWDFYGDGNAQVQFFRQYSNYNELLSNASQATREALRDWTRGAFMRHSRHDGFENMDSYGKKLTRLFDKILDKANLTQGVLVKRLANSYMILGKRDGTLAEYKAAEGNIITIHDNGSWSAASTGLTIGQSKNTEFELYIPPSKGAGMWVGDHRVNGWGPEQREFMTNRDIVVEVGPSHFDRAKGVNVVRLYYRGRAKHDYGKNGK